MINNKKPKLISIFKKSGIGIIKPVTYATKTSAIDYVKFSTQQTINGTPPGNLPSIN